MPDSAFVPPCGISWITETRDENPSGDQEGYRSLIHYCELIPHHQHRHRCLCGSVFPNPPGRSS